MGERFNWDKGKAGISRLKVFTAMAVALAVGLTTVSCTADDPPAGRPAPSVASSGRADASMTFEEAYRRVPMNGINDLQIHWDRSPFDDVEEVLAARRSHVFKYWLDTTVDWAPVIPIARRLFVEQYYQEVMAPFAASKIDDPAIGPIWVKVMGVDGIVSDQARVTFCTDIGWWHDASKGNDQYRKNRASLQSYVMTNVSTDDGGKHWLADRKRDSDADREAKYQAQCTKWAKHKP